MVISTLHNLRIQTRVSYPILPYIFYMSVTKQTWILWHGRECLNPSIFPMQSFTLLNAHYGNWLWGTFMAGRWTVWKRERLLCSARECIALRFAELICEVYRYDWEWLCVEYYLWLGSYVFWFLNRFWIYSIDLWLESRCLRKGYHGNK